MELSELKTNRPKDGGQKGKKADNDNEKNLQKQKSRSAPKKFNQNLWSFFALFFTDISKKIFPTFLHTDRRYELRFCVGDKFYLCDDKILCQYHYEERMTFLQAAYNNHSYTEISRNLQKLDDFEPVIH